MEGETRAQVVLATNNAKKLAELRAAMDSLDLPIEVLSLSDVEPYPEPDETERTFEGNALIKARECALRTGLPALADDSGIEVGALNNCPGVRSARWAGTRTGDRATDDQANNDLLIAQISDVPEGQREARFVCAMAFVIPDQMGGMRHWESLRAEWPGQMAFEPRGENGFGYDPLFIPDDAPQVDGRRLTSAELDPAHKNEISHRGQAVRRIVPAVAGLLNLKMPEEGAGFSGNDQKES
ncbi:non-canonical purine NTP pyrophosphatase [Luteococcus sp. Sow4_B9]|uniref:non-canonical purine NTP pyrophosphatase n=1 Tax=Luteococcus sp. Sow4_B9 TaxID=3438792 RepID=UPI003F95DCB7